MNAGSRVNDYISRLADWQQAVCQHVRQLVHDADPEVEETIKRSVLPYRMHDSPGLARLAIHAAGSAGARHATTRKVRSHRTGRLPAHLGAARTVTK
jgi:hypothetical protein